MRILLDTHVALWAITDDVRLPELARGLILDSQNEIFVSAASVWEIAIKHSLARHDMPVSGKQATAWFQVAGYVLLSISAIHAAAIEELPQIHADPFDRLIVAQALTEPLRLLTHDQTVARYNETIMLV
ncbi:MAG: twitching motility protein PilT [Lentisphaerae bacterium RIFOXYB12_FULL_65_16]|nr:MAG: twitching motility protein PilT [Lentisphaerae bacterium RIFOXYA12_64_32]OGV91896.1 MAG: twitching motility protein PilT [Lentisphaerae bacterium RIFOXYB12_FULL_65_16]